MTVKTDANKLWKNCLLLIKGNVSEQQYSTWFKPIVCELYDDSTHKLVLQVPSPFVYEYIEENYIDLVRKALKRVLGEEKVQISYRVVTDKTHNMSQVFESDAAEQVSEPLKKQGVNLSPNQLDAAKPQPIDSQLDSKKTFSNFIEGASNRLPRAVGLSIAEHPSGTKFNPMFVYGPSGCGKTHLINAIGLQTKQLYPEKRVLYVSARLFQVQFADATRRNVTPDFIKFYQSIDMIIVDDVQEWMTSPATQNTFFHIFDHLFRTGKRIILASDRPPVSLQGMPERLITRFSCGLIAEIEKPNHQLCIDILNNKIKRDGLQIPHEVVRFIAETANGSVRDLEGIVNSLMAYSVVYDSDIDLKLAERVIKRSVNIDNKPLTVDEILERVCHHFNVSAEEVSGKSRKKEFVQARQLSMYLAQKHTKMPASRIGQLIGNRDHSTVLHSCTQVKCRLEADKGFLQEVQRIEETFKLKR